MTITNLSYLHRIECLFTPGTASFLCLFVKCVQLLCMYLSIAVCVVRKSFWVAFLMSLKLVGAQSYLFRRRWFVMPTFFLTSIML